MAEKAKPNPLVPFLGSRGPLLLGLAAFALVRIQSGSWWWAILAFMVVYLVLPMVIAIVLGFRAGKRPDPPKVFIPVPEIADDDVSRRCVAEVRDARDALIRIGSARIEHVRDIEIEDQKLGRGPLARGMNKFVDVVRHHVGEGVIDLRQHRMMLDYGHYAETQIGAEEYARYSGGPLRSVEDRPGSRSEGWPTPLWFITVLAHATRAAESGEDDVDEDRCRQLDVLLNLTAPSPPESPPLWIPEWPDPTAVPLVVWLEGSNLRRLRYQETAGTTYTLTLRDLGLDLSGLDWERLGTFRTPDPNHHAEPNVV